MIKSQLFKHAHQITKMKNIQYFGSYQKAFSAVLKQLYAEQVAFGFRIEEPRHLWS